MAVYEVQLEIRSYVWMDVEADNADEAIETARETYRISDAQCPDVADTSAVEKVA